MIIELMEMEGCDYFLEGTSYWAVRKGFYLHISFKLIKILFRNSEFRILIRKKL